MTVMTVVLIVCAIVAISIGLELAVGGDDADYWDDEDDAE